MTKNKLIFIITFAIAIRIFLMFSTYHPDLAGQSLSSYFWGFKNVINPYEHLLSLSSSHPLVKNFGVTDIFIYPPLTYFTLGTFQKIFAFSGLKQFLETVMNGYHIYQIPNLGYYLFLLKLPYLFVDLAVAYIIFLYFKETKYKYFASILWLFNPITLYTTFCMGVFDIIPVFFTVLALYYVKKNKLNAAALSIGFGVAFKMYPIFLLPFIILKASQRFLPRLKILLLGLLPVIVTNLPYLTSSAYRFMVFSPKSQKMLYMQWKLSGAEGLYPFLVFSILLFLQSQNLKIKTRFFNSYFFVFFLLLFSVTHYHPQWFIWITPFLLIELINFKLKDLWLYVILVLSYIFIVFTFENSLNIGLFAPLNPVLAQFSGTANFIASKTDINNLKSMIRSVFAGISLYFALTHINNAQKK